MAKKKSTYTRTKKVTVKNLDYTEVRGKEEDMQTHESGALRSVDKGKGRFDLLTFWGLRRIAIHMENGAEKYAARNWEKGLPLSRYLNSAIRHTYMCLLGLEDEDHAAAAAWNLHCFLHTQEMIRMGKLPGELDDLPDYGDLEPMLERLYG